MSEPPVPLTALSEAQRAQALERFALIRLALEKTVSQAQVSRTHHLLPSMVQLWIKEYREKGFAELANAACSDKGTSRKRPETAIQLIEELALQKSPCSMAAIHRQVTTITQKQGWTLIEDLLRRLFERGSLVENQRFSKRGVRLITCHDSISRGALWMIKGICQQ